MPLRHISRFMFMLTVVFARSAVAADCGWPEPELAGDQLEYAV